MTMGDESNNSAKETRHLYSLLHQEYVIMAEYRMLQTENLRGIYVIPSYESSFVWFGVIFVRSGCYDGGIFRFTLTLPEKFPNDGIPVVIFNTPLYHPAVDLNSGILNLSEVFPHWDKKRNHIWQILKYVHWIFYNLNVKVPVNLEASINFKSNKKLFMDKVKECVSVSVSHLYDEPGVDDKHYITFKPYDPDVHEPAKISMLKTPSQEGVTQGTSWVEPGSFQPFSKNESR